MDLRLALIVLFGLAWLTERSGASLLIAGFGSGLMVASTGGPKRPSNEVLGIAGRFFIPLFFVVLGARLDLHGLFSDPALIALAGTLTALNVLVHLLAARIVRLPRAAGLVASAQLGVPAALVALGLPQHGSSAFPSQHASDRRHGKGPVTMTHARSDPRRRSIGANLTDHYGVSVPLWARILRQRNRSAGTIRVTPSRHASRNRRA